MTGRSERGEPLCRACYRKDPVSSNECTGCRKLTRLHHHGLCVSCARTAAVQQLVSDAQGRSRPELEPLARVLLAGNPASTLEWLRRTSSKTVLGDLLAHSAPISHQAIDGLRHGKATRHLRALLVAEGALPLRDEYLAALENWLPTALQRISDPRERRIVRSFANWHHLRRLRRQSRSKMLTWAQAHGARRDIEAAIKLLTWLGEHRTTLTNCSQADIDRWLDEAPGTGPMPATS